MAERAVYEGRDRKSNALKWTGTRVDLIFGSHAQQWSGVSKQLESPPARCAFYGPLGNILNAQNPGELT